MSNGKVARTPGLDRRTGLEAWMRVLGADFLVPPLVTSLRKTQPREAQPLEAPLREVELADVEPLEVQSQDSPSLEELETTVTGCTACPLHKGRQQTVFADGNPKARIFFIGEGPGADEDRTGVPFVGKAGQLLTRMIEGAMGLCRKDVYIANVVKCRPPGNRNPSPEEQACCGPFLEKQIEIVDPDILVCLGAVAARYVLQTELGAGRLRGQVHQHAGRPVVVTWHPAYLLRNPGAKRETWVDIKRVLETLGLPENPPPHQAG